MKRKNLENLKKENLYNYLDDEGYTVFFINKDGVVRSLGIDKDNKIITFLMTSINDDSFITSIQFRYDDFDLIIDCFKAILEFNHNEEYVRNLIEENKNAKEKSSSTAS